ncbi:hypothetical protein [Corynebacterium glyciniphilum]|uniref:hypothetical protein n=1 Tax=Corynebacterium glyciniphilum TaxID=1404244 RepID=UPI0026510444|nr:hypothetical protein [Corynebacterium glyciniphilum]MDN6706399.1 hypothetical protein [Corynebacterium glyciniphilum]
MSKWITLAAVVGLAGWNLHTAAKIERLATDVRDAFGIQHSINNVIADAMNRRSHDR